MTTAENWTAYDVILAAGHLDPDTRFESVLLGEPAKSVVLAWKRGDAFPREADVLLEQREGD